MEPRILPKLRISFTNCLHPRLLCLLLCRFQSLNSGHQACSACGVISQDQCFVPYRCSRHPPFGDSHTRLIHIVTPLFLGLKNHCLPPGKYEGTGWRFASFFRLSRRDLLSSDPYLFVENWSQSSELQREPRLLPASPQPTGLQVECEQSLTILRPQAPAGWELSLRPLYQVQFQGEVSASTLTISLPLERMTTSSRTK